MKGLKLITLEALRVGPICKVKAGDHRCSNSHTNTLIDPQIPKESRPGLSLSIRHIYDCVFVFGRGMIQDEDSSPHDLASCKSMFTQRAVKCNNDYKLLWATKDFL